MTPLQFLFCFLKYSIFEGLRDFHSVRGVSCGFFHSVIPKYYYLLPVAVTMSFKDYDHFFLCLLTHTMFTHLLLHRF